jgi:hypothetical protein
LRWVDVDASEAMVRLFSNNMRRARMRTTVILGDADKQTAYCLEERDEFDVIVMSWLLSSMPADLPLKVSVRPNPGLTS